MKKLIFSLLIFLGIASCKQEDVTPSGLTIQVLESGTDSPIPNAKLLFYKTNAVGGGPAFELVDSSVTNHLGVFPLIEIGEIDCVTVASQDDAYYFDVSDILCGLNGRAQHCFRVKSRAQLSFSLTDELNVLSSLNHVDIRIAKGFKNRLIESTLYPNSSCDSLFVFANEPVELEFKRVYDSGASTYEYLTLSPLAKNEVHHISLTF